MVYRSMTCTCLADHAHSGIHAMAVDFDTVLTVLVDDMKHDRNPGCILL